MINIALEAMPGLKPYFSFFINKKVATTNDKTVNMNTNKNI
jgi:hypothetical protein